jgi:hypothetical protein
MSSYYGKTRYYYIDDSGAEKSGIVTYSWIEFDAGRSKSLMRTWLTLRERLNAEYGVSVYADLHASSARVPAMELILHTLGNYPFIRIGTVYRRTDKKGADFYQEKIALFGKLLSSIDAAVDNEATAALFVDGKGSHRLRAQYKTLRPQAIRTLEFKPAKETQLLQATDIVAWTTYQSIAKNPGKEVAATWYETYLRPRDVRGGPTAA